MSTENDQAQAQVHSTLIPRIVTVGRAGLVLAGLVALLAAILDLEGSANIPFLLRLFGALGLLACAIAATVKPLRALDMSVVALAALLAGAASVWAFNPYEISVISLFAWFLLLGFGGAVAAGLASGPPIVDQAFSGQMESMFSSSRTAPLPPPTRSSAPPPPPAPPAPAATAPKPPPPPAPAAAKAPARPKAPSPQAKGPAAAAAEATGGKPAGWYAVEDGKIARWWDGSAWTEHTRPLPSGGDPQ